MDENLTELDGNEIYDNWDQLMDNSAPKTQTDSIGLDGLMEGLDSDIKIKIIGWIYFNRKILPAWN